MWICFSFIIWMNSIFYFVFFCSYKRMKTRFLIPLKSFYCFDFDEILSRAAFARSMQSKVRRVASMNGSWTNMSFMLLWNSWNLNDGATSSFCLRCPPEKCSANFEMEDDMFLTASFKNLSLSARLVARDVDGVLVRDTFDRES